MAFAPFFIRDQYRREALAMHHHQQRLRLSLARIPDHMILVRRIARGLTILIVEHDMQVVMGLAHRITVLHYGEILAEGTPAEIQANPRVLEVCEPIA